MSERVTQEIQYEEIVQRLAAETVHQPSTATVRPSELPGPLPELPRLRTRSVDGIPDLEVGEPIGEGGMGVVLNAIQTPLMRRVAVKTVHEATTASVTSLLQEALITGLLEHPNVVPVHLLGSSEGGEPLIVMKRVEGVDWWTIITDPSTKPGKGVANLDWHLDVLLQVCDALRFAHSRGIVHRDIKPENVMIGSFDEVYLLDWGVAISIAPGISPHYIRGRDEANGIAGTPAYMAPEQVEDDAHNVGTRTDVFLLGATLHHVLTGRPPYQGENMVQSMVAAHRCEPQRYGKHVQTELADIARKAMARSVDHRYRSVDEFKEALQAYRRHRDAIALVQEAERRLHRIQVLAASQAREPSRELTESVIETRFALRRAISQWPENGAARELLARLANVVFHHYVERGDLVTAAGLLGDMTPENEATNRRLLDSARASKDAQVRRLEELDFQGSDAVDAKSRILLGVGLAVVWSLVAWYKAFTRWGVPLEEVDPNYLVSLIPTVGIPLILAVIFHRLWISNQYNRRMFFMFFAGLFAVTMIRIIGWRFHVPAHLTTSMEFVFYAMVAFMVGVISDMRIAAASGLIALAAVLAMLFPLYQYAFMGAAFLLFAPFVGWLWRPSAEA